jgi:peptidoglycan glycosyltransferase
MNKGIWRVGLAMIVLFIGLVAQLTYLQVSSKASDLANDPRNVRKTLRDLQRQRGDIISGDGAILAESVKSGDEYKYQRVYPTATAQLFAHVVGYQSLQFGSVGVEKTYSSDLSGNTFKLSAGSLADVFANNQPVGTVYLTMSRLLQQVAHDALAGQRGTAILLDVQTGGVVAMYSNPTFDPNLLVSHNTNAAHDAWKFYNAAPENPLLARAWREIYPPGSTFKTVTASIALQSNTDVNKVFPPRRQIPLPQTTQTLSNFGNELCGGTLENGFIVSCNTVYGQVGLDLGEKFATGLPRFGVETSPPNSDFDPRIVGSTGPQKGSFRFNMPSFAYGAIGQQTVAVTPIEMALVAEAVATGGVILEPHVADCVKDQQNHIVKRIGTGEYSRAMDPATAAQMKTFMLGVVAHGTGTAAQIPGVLVAGKTGTAETAPNERPHAWFIAFAPADHPRYAVAVLVEHGGNNGQNAEATGGRVAAPIAKQLLQAALAQPTTPSQCKAGK